ncbi:MAG TPA: hypothetical protein DCX60_08340 [Phycisphaerales bacterium]|nr:hypothetical protein [Phycisphaerales bacterium]
MLRFFHFLLEPDQISPSSSGQNEAQTRYFLTTTALFVSLGMSSMPATPKLRMLDWSRTLACSGAEHLHRHLHENPSASACSVLLPGRRVRRRLQKALLDASLRSGGRDAVECPRLLTASGLVEAFLESNSTLRPVDDSISIVFWAEAFKSLGRDAGRLLGREVVHESSSLPRVTILRQVCEDLDAIGMTPHDVLETGFDVGSEERWNALEALRRLAHERLQSSGLVERTLHRHRMIQHGVLRLDAPGQLFVLGVNDPGPLTMAFFKRFPDRVTILVQGPNDGEDQFDEFGRPRPEAWLNRSSVVPREAMSLVDRPIDAGEVLLEQLARSCENAPLKTDDFVVGLCDERQAGVLERCGRRARVPLRSAAGSALSQGEVARVIDGVSNYLRSPDIVHFSELLRLPSCETCLSSKSAQDAVRHLDSWREKRVGGTLEDLRTLSPDSDGGGDELLRNAVMGLDRMLAPVTEARDVQGRLLAAGALLRTIFESQREKEMVSRSLDALESLINTLNSCDGLPFISSSALFDLFSRMLKSLRCPAAPIDPERGAIEMLGWLDVRNEPASNIVLVGFNDSGELGSAPSDGWLTQTLRGSLGLPTEDSRQARDAHAMHVLQARTPNLQVIVSRHDHRGDPVVPSRLFLGSGGQESAHRVLETMSTSPRSFPAHQLIGSPSPSEHLGFPAPDMPEHPVIDRLRVTDFASWIRSPKRFWLERLSRLKTVESNHLELDARSFGILAHDVLERFGRSGLRDSTDEVEIVALLEAELDDLVMMRYGAPCAPAIEIQRRMLRDRLRRFAFIQARDAASGWHAHSVEETLECRLEIPDHEPVTLVGRVDRIDRHVDGRWRVLDYKTSEKAVTASSKFSKDGVWNDLQLPLYDLLMRRTIADPGDSIELGYVSLPRALQDVGISVATKWDSDIIQSGIELARTIVREMRSYDFSRPPRGRSFGHEVDGIDRILRSSVLLTGADDEEESES